MHDKGIGPDSNPESLPEWLPMIVNRMMHQSGNCGGRKADGYMSPLLVQYIRAKKEPVGYIQLRSYLHPYSTLNVSISAECVKCSNCL